VFTGRAGALLRGTFGSTGAVWQPYLKGNVWWGDASYLSSVSGESRITLKGNVGMRVTW
jgi:hypothetical protein